MSTITKDSVADAVKKFVEVEKMCGDQIDVARKACFEVTIEYLNTAEGVRRHLFNIYIFRCNELVLLML
jgi:hypothetical protein